MGNKASRKKDDADIAKIMKERDGASINVNSDGSVTVSYPDGTSAHYKGKSRR